MHCLRSKAVQSRCATDIDFSSGGRIASLNELRDPRSKHRALTEPCELHVRASDQVRTRLFQHTQLSQDFVQTPITRYIQIRAQLCIDDVAHKRYAHRVSNHQRNQIEVSSERQRDSVAVQIAELDLQHMLEHAVFDLRDDGFAFGALEALTQRLVPDAQGAVAVCLSWQ